MGQNKQEIFAARDRFGIKPLYFYTDGKLTIFASEIKAILAHPDVAREPNEQGIADYLFCGRPLEGKRSLRMCKR
jgi:asparagine synthase (glutamine-hydrolysing)